MSGTYNNNFYDLIRYGCQISADVIVPIVFDVIKPHRVLDIGCGEGWWAQKFKDLGCEVLGVDGEYVNSSPLGEDFMSRDIDIIDSLLSLPKADLIVCLEVAEHLPSSRSESFVAELCALAPTILFSAAIPGQPGVDHINCQWPSWWHELFAQHGMHVSGKIRDRFWREARVEPWYRQNLLIITKNPDLYPGYFPDNTTLDRMHPTIASWMR